MTSRFIAKMEDVLAVYQRPYDPRYPLVCLDEKGKELQAQTHPILPMQAHQPHANRPRQDYTYQRHGSAYLLLISEPLRGWRRVAVGEDRSHLSFAQELKQLVDEDYPNAERIVLVTDNLNIHGPWSLYDTFPAAEARRIANKLEWHYTPEHGSWLNMAEIELSALERQCLGRRFGDIAELRSEVEVWMKDRNQRSVKIRWQFTAADARIRLRRLYPNITDKT